ncbi:MAG: Helix-turn-helix domain [Actinomycetota bacterium]|jgi:transcriptional regulator with XRE-family HTH domain|nr:Helix-turn-helix domain [Actinomycetota bacterium]
MDHLDESSPGVVALLLDDLAPPRLGTLLRAARKHTGSTRREVARRVGTTPSDLRRYERGDTPVPPRLIAALAECYGEELTTQLATRAPIQLDERRLVVGTESRALESDDADELLGHYVEIVARLRSSQPGEPLALRTDDLVALSSALGQDSDRVEARIVVHLGCTPYEAHSLHSEMLRRKLVLPLAGLVAGIAMVSGAGTARASAGAQAPVSDSVSHVAAAHITAGHVAAGNVVTAVVEVPPTTVVAKPPAPAAPETPTTEAPAPEAPTPEATDAPVVDAQATMPPPVIQPDDTPMGIPANETVTIIQP